jgi:copper(I)-binding protein
MNKTLTSLLLLFMLLTACSPTASPVARPDVSQNGIEVYQARVPYPVGMTTDDNNMNLQMDMTLAAFMVIKNTTDTPDRLLSVSVDFAQASMHETKIDGDIAQMVEVPGIDIPAGQTVELKSGSYHIMLMNPMKELKAGDTVNLTLEFEKAGTIIVPAKVVAQ